MSMSSASVNDTAFMNLYEVGSRQNQRRSVKIYQRPTKENIAMDRLSRMKLYIRSICRKTFSHDNSQSDENEKSTDGHDGSFPFPLNDIPEEDENQRRRSSVDFSKEVNESAGGNSDVRMMQSERSTSNRNRQFKIVSKQIQPELVSLTQQLMSFLKPIYDLCDSLFGSGFVHWSMQSSYLHVVLWTIAMFSVQMFSFALIIWGIFQWVPECVITLSTEEHKTRDAFVLSWTTYSTVGYGHVSPSVDGPECNLLQVVCVYEAMVGVLYAGFAAAVLFAKVWADQGIADVEFSDGLILRFGPAEIDPHEYQKEEDLQSSSDDSDDDESNNEIHGDGRLPPKSTFPPLRRRPSHLKAHHPYPVLEFRIANKLEATRLNLMLDAKIECVVASETAKQIQKRELVETYAAESSQERRSGASLNFHKRGSQDPMDVSRHARDMRSSEVQRLISQKRQDSILLGDDNRYQLVEVLQPRIPVFKRIWHVRHVLDENSPLVKKKVKRMIREQGGWPPEINSNESIRDSIRKFSHLVVVFQAVTHSGIIAFAHKTYEYLDVFVGYRFADVSYVDITKGEIRIDRNLLSDVVEQDGDEGGEYVLKRRHRRKLSRSLSNLLPI